MSNKIDFTKFDLDAYVEQFAKLDSKRSKSGDTWYQCTFHDEDTASFHVTDKQVYYCHGCAESGGVLDFVKKINKIPTSQAFKIIEENLGVESVATFTEQEPTEFFVPQNHQAMYSYNGGYVLKYRLDKGYIWANFKDNTWWVGTGDYDVELYAPNGLNGTVILAEGEKDADTLCSLGFNGASSPNGTYKWKDSYTNQLANADRIVIMNDEDYVGIASSQKVQYILNEAGYTTKRISPLEIIDSDIEGFDITDAYEAYGYDTYNKLNELIENSQYEWNELWNTPQEEIKTEEIVEVEIVQESGLGDEYDKLIETAVQETLSDGMVSELTEIEIRKQAKDLGITPTIVKNRIKNELASRNTPRTQTKDSKVMSLEDLDLQIDISGSGYVIDPDTSAIYNDNGEEIIGHFLGFAGVVIDAEASQDTNVKIALAYNTPQNLGKLQLVIVPKKLMATSLDMIKVLSGYNINVTQANGIGVVQYLQDIQNFFNEKTVTMKSLSRFGWYDGKLMPYEQEHTGIVFDSTVAQPTADKLLATKGTRSASLELIKDVVSNSEVGATMVGAAVGSLILSFINDGGNQSFALNVWAGTGTGKSVTSQAVASMFGYPFKDGFWADGNATMNKDIYHNSLLCNLPTFIDDPALNRGYDSFQKRDYIYAVTSGQGRGRMQRSGDVAQDVKEWCNIMIMTNETPFIESTIADGGARARCLEVNFDEKLERDRIERWIDLMTNNYGHFALEIAQAIREKGKYALESEIKTYIRWFSSNGILDKRSYNASIIMVGLNLITLTLDLEHGDVRNWLAKQIRSTGTLSDGERAYEKLLSIIDVSIETYRGILDRNGVLVGSLGYDIYGAKVINLPRKTIFEYSKQEVFNPSVLIAWLYANGKAYAQYDENDSPKLVVVSNDDTSVEVIQLYYEWGGNQTTNEYDHKKFHVEKETMGVIDV